MEKQPSRAGSLWRNFSFGGQSGLNSDEEKLQNPNLRQKSLKAITEPPPAPPDLNISQLQNHLSKTSANPNLSSVVKLGRDCLDEGTQKSGESFPERSSDMVYAGALLLEWANFRDADISYPIYRQLAYAHYESWLTRGIEGEVEHLTYAKSSYEKALKDNSICSNSSVWLEYCKVLMHLGESEQGLKTINTMIRRFDGHQNMPLFYLTAGAVLSAMGDYEKAGNCFFECIQLGLPRYFSKSELMFVLSRSFEQLGFETKATASDPVEEGYIMVFNHMVSENVGSFDKNITYEMWISDYKTWRNIADKCAMHGLFSLAADLYGQGLVRDRNAYVKSSLWFRFAKSCFRCGRTSDAQLAVKQAVTLDPDNTQCALALKSWSAYSSVVLDLVEGPLQDVLDLLPVVKSKPDAAAQKIQAFYRGQQTRFCAGSRLTFSSRRDLLKSLKASAGLVVGEQHPLLLTVRPNWKGDITRIHFYDIHSNKTGLIVMKCPFRLPLKRFNPAWTYHLTLSCGCLNQSRPESVELEPGGDKKLYMVVITFRELESGFYSIRHVYLMLDANGNLSISEGTVDVVHPSRPVVPRNAHQFQDDFSDCGGDNDDDVNQSVKSIGDSSLVTDQSDSGEVIVADRIHALFGAYRRRRGIFRYFGNLFLYNASLVTLSNGHAQPLVATPSATAYKVANQKTKSFIRVQLLLVSDKDKRLCFVLPPLLSMLENISDILAVLLLGVNSVPMEKLSSAAAANFPSNAEMMPALTPRSDGVSIYNGKMEILMRALGRDDSGEEVVAVEDFPTDEESLDKYMDSVRSVLEIHLQKEAAWLFLQDKVAEALQYDFVCPEDMSQFTDSVADISLLSDRSERSKYLPKVVTEGSRPREDSEASFPLASHISLEQQETVPESVHSESSTDIRMQDEVPEDSSVHSGEVELEGLEVLSVNSGDVDVIEVEEQQHDVSFHSRALELCVDRQAGDSVVCEGALEVEETQDTLPSWLNNRGTFRFYGERFLYTSELSSVDSNGYEIKLLNVSSDNCYRFILSKSLTKVENISDILAVLLLGVTSVPMEKLSSAAAANFPSNAEMMPALTPRSDGVSIYNGKMEILMRALGRDDSGEEVVAVEDFPTDEESLDKYMDSVRSVLEIHLQKEAAWLFLQDKVLKAEMEECALWRDDSAKTKEYDAIKLSDELEEDTHMAFVYHAPDVDHNNIALLHMAELSSVEDDPYASAGDISSYRSTIDTSDDRQTVNVQAAFFLAFQVQRLEALDFLVDRAAAAKHRVTRREAFMYLQERACQARANPVPSTRRVIDMSEPSPRDKPLSVEAEGESREDPEKHKFSPPKPGTAKQNPLLNRKIGKDDNFASRRGSVPCYPVQNVVSKRRQSVEYNSSQSSRDHVTDDPLATKLQSLLEEKLKDEKFTENPEDLVVALQSFSLPQDKTEEEDVNETASQLNTDLSDPARNADSPGGRSTSILDSLPPQKAQELETKMASIGSIQRLSTTGKGRRNPVDFLEPVDDASGLEPMFDESILSFLQMGYSSGTCAYLAIWKNKLRACLRKFSSPAQLDKALHSLQRAYPAPLSRAGAFCALAETGGSIGEALGQLNDKTFKHELVLVCQALPVDEIILRLAEHMRKLKSNTVDHNDVDHRPCVDDSNVAEIMRPTQIMRSDSGPDFAARSEIDLFSSSAPLATSEQTVDTPPSHASRTLPNFGMKSNSSTVLSRGTAIRRFKDGAEKSLSSSSFFPPIISVSAAPQQHSPSRNISPVTTYNSKKKNLSLSALIALPPVEKSAVTPKGILVHGQRGATEGHGGTAPPKFNRMGKTIDLLAEETDSMVVMSRLQAYRAHEEAMLLKYHPDDRSYYRTSRQKRQYASKLRKVHNASTAQEIGGS